MADIFISYARSEREKIAKLSSALEAEGYSVWWDHHIAGGAEYARDIERELHAAKYIIVAWTKNSVNSMWVADEATIGRDQRNLIPLAMEEVDPPIGFRQVQTIPFHHWSGEQTGDQFASLIRALTQGSQDTKTTTEQSTISTRAGVSLIVLPFRTISTQKQDQVLTIAIHEDLTTQLARVKDYFVISRSTASHYENKETSPMRLARELGVTYVLDGSVRRAGDDIRVTAQLVDAVSGGHVAALNFDRSASDLLGLQNDLIAEIINHLGSEINLAEVRRLEQRANLNPNAIENYRLARVTLEKMGWNKKGVETALSYLEAALKEDPDYAPVISHMALMKGLAAGAQVINENVEAVKPEVVELAHRALAIDRQSSDVLGFAGCALCDVGEVDDGLVHLERAVEIDPSNAQAHAAYGWACILQDRLEEGIAKMSAAIRISPQHSGLAFWLFGLATGYQELGDIKAAKTTLERAIRFDPKFSKAYELLAAILAAEGDKKGSQRLKDRAIKIAKATHNQTKLTSELESDG